MMARRWQFTDTEAAKVCGILSLYPQTDELFWLNVDVQNLGGDRDHVGPHCLLNFSASETRSTLLHT
jgi:hypothetical protein